jgi:hypothetical protein
VNYELCTRPPYLDSVCLHLRVCCIITSEEEKCCLKYENRGVSQGFYISNNISTPKYYSDSTIGKYKVDFQSLRESKMCQSVIGFTRTPRYLIVCRQSVVYFPCMYVKNKIHVYIQYWRLISKIKFESLVFCPEK